MISMIRDSGGENSTYTAVVHDLDDSGELAFEGTAADQHQAANLDQLPGRDLDIDIGHSEILEQKFSVALSVGIMRAHSRSTLGMESKGVVERVQLSRVSLEFRMCPQLAPILA